MSPVTDRSLAREDPLSKEHVEESLREYLDAVQASVKASRALLTAGPGERQKAHRAFMDASRRQADAERAYERARQGSQRPPLASRHRLRPS